LVLVGLAVLQAATQLFKALILCLVHWSTVQLVLLVAVKVEQTLR
jgi:hypothetical protein